jgi:hypothetical protein
MPFVANRVQKEPKKRLIDKVTEEIINDPKINGRLLLEQWKESNGYEGFSPAEEEVYGEELEGEALEGVAEEANTNPDGLPEKKPWGERMGSSA